LMQNPSSVPPVYVNVSPKFFNHGNDESTNTSTTPQEMVPSSAVVAGPLENTNSMIASSPNIQPASSSSNTTNTNSSAKSETTDDIFANKNLLIVKK